MHGGPGPSRRKSLATPGSIVVGHRPEVRQEARGSAGWSSTRSSVAPPRRFRQVGRGVGQMTYRMISPGARLVWKRAQTSVGDVEGGPNVEHGDCSVDGGKGKGRGGSIEGGTTGLSKTSTLSEILNTHRPRLAIVKQNRPD